MQGKPVLIVISIISSLHLYKSHNNPWLAMLFSAAMGIESIIFGITEPVIHYLLPPADHAHAIANTARRALGDNKLRPTGSAEE